MSVDFFENGLCILCHVAEMELRHYSDFHHGVEELWQRRDEDLQNEISALLLKFPEADHDDIVDSHAWELHCNQLKYPQIHRAALTVVIYSFMEAQLNRMCEIIQDSISSRVRLKDVHGQGIERAILYLSRVAGFDFGKVAGLTHLRDVGLVRNSLVHAGGELPVDKNAPVCNVVTRTEGIEGNPGDEIRIAAKFVFDCADGFISFFHELNLEVVAFMGRVDRGEA